MEYDFDKFDYLPKDSKVIMLGGEDDPKREATRDTSFSDLPLTGFQYNRINTSSIFYTGRYWNVSGTMPNYSSMIVSG